MQVKYLLLFPLVKHLHHGSSLEIRNIKDTPYFLDIDIDIEPIRPSKFELFKHQITQEASIYDNSVVVCTFTYDIGAELSEKNTDLKTKINNEIRIRTLKEFGYQGDLVEEYIILLITKFNNPSKFVEKNKHILAKFMRSLSTSISEPNAEETLTSKISYSNKDLVIVDWETTLIMDQDSDYESEIQLLRIGNYQLLRYRILDTKIQESLESIRYSLGKPSKKKQGKSLVKRVVEDRLSLLLDFDKVDQSLLLVGDWYSAKLYRTIVSEFYINEWQLLVKNKLDNLESIDTVARENLSINWQRTLDFVEIIAWLLLLVGYYFLFMKESGILK